MGCSGGAYISYCSEISLLRMTSSHGDHTSRVIEAPPSMIDRLYTKFHRPDVRRVPRETVDLRGDALIVSALMRSSFHHL